MNALASKDVVRALYRHFGQRWAMLTEVTARPVPGVYTRRRIDVLLLRQVGDRIERLAIEVKVSRGDFLSDIRMPEKQAPWRAIAQRHAYAVPLGLVDEAEVPAESGLIVVDRPNPAYPGTVRFARRAPRPTSDPGDLPVSNVMDAFWRTARYEATAKGYAEPTANELISVA